jgi:hypothetical protein
MRLHDMLSEIGETYDQKAGFETAAQMLLRTAAQELDKYAPIGYQIRASGGQYPLGTTTTPWIGFFDPEETTGPQEGLYVVYLLRADGSAWTLSANMGTERLARHIRSSADAAVKIFGIEREVLNRLHVEATAIRAALPLDVHKLWDPSIDLRSKGVRQARYEAAAILGRTYELASFPEEERLHSELRLLLKAYEQAVQAKRQLAVTDPGSISTASSTADPGYEENIEYMFSPGTDVPAEVHGKAVYRRTPRHETGIQLYGQWLIERGHKVSTKVHPRDLVIQSNATTWLGEYKVVYGGNDTRASREAHSQLKEYSYFLHPASNPPLVAVFSEPIRAEKVGWLLNEGIESVWFGGATWQGTPGAVKAGLAEPPTATNHS